MNKVLHAIHQPSPKSLRPTGTANTATAARPSEINELSPVVGRHSVKKGRIKLKKRLAEPDFTALIRSKLVQNQTGQSCSKNGRQPVETDQFHKVSAKRP